MPLTKMSPLLQHAGEQNMGIGAFSVANMEMILGAIRAAEECETPIILQTAEARLPFSPLHIIGPMMVAAAKRATVPVAVHLDHGKSLDVLEQALALGFTSIMLDASDLALESNIEKTSGAVRLARRYNADIEAEIGRLGIAEDGAAEGEALCTDPTEAETFSQITGVDALAVSIGNAHGPYTKQPNLQLGVLEQIHGTIPTPLVLHGGSGLTSGDFRACIDRGIRKLNIATANFSAAAHAAKLFAGASAVPDYFNLNRMTVDMVCENVKEHIQIFRNGH